MSEPQPERELTPQDEAVMDRAAILVTRFMQAMREADLPGITNDESLVALLSAWMTEAIRYGSRQKIANMLAGAHNAVLTTPHPLHPLDPNA